MKMKNFFLIITLMVVFNMINSESVNGAILCETECRESLLKCFNSPICKEGVETCYPKCNRTENKRRKIDFVCLTDCLANFQSEAKDDLIECADFCNFRESFRLLNEITNTL